ncbi:SIS domain-containing protein [Patescibacteria group bacterium]|nr:SIS domain-containing protein [Patescibacteria group bacterium]
MSRKNYEKLINKYDTKDVLGSVDLLPEQCLHAWGDMKKVKFPKQYKQINTIVLFGMGGSALGIDVARAVYGNDIKVPIEIVNDYMVPEYINKDTLVILSSYSGSTEETTAAAKKIEKKTKKIFVITTGKDLLKFAKKKNYPVYVINPEYNPCEQPRVAVGYSVMAQFAMLNKLGLIKFTDKDVQNIFKFLKKNAKKI